ncbi:MAG: hypothetical protein FWD38_10580 [Oscillospiraceae bacterium]|nr:hypothetical protein [Oscillospiraceae bacterium]
MKINVLVVNENSSEGSSWRERLGKKGYTVLPECLNMSDVFYILTQEKVHIVICAGSMFKEETIPLLESSQIYFPRIKIVLVGIIDKDYLFSNLSNVALTKWFPSELEKYCDPLAMASVNVKLSTHQALSLLMDDHYLNGDEAKAILKQSSKLTPGFAVILIRTDFTNDNVYKVLGDCISTHMKTFLLPYRQNEFIIIVDDSPDMEYCGLIAADIRAKLLKNTNTMFSIGISRIRDKAEELFACRKEAERACSATHMFGKNSVIFINYLSPNDIEYIYPSHKEKRLVEATMDGDTDYALEMLDEIFDVIKSREGLRQSLINKIVLGILVSLNTAASSRVSVYEKMNLDSLSLKTLMTAKTIDEAYNFLRQGICDFAGEMEEITDVTRDALFHKLSVSKDVPGTADELAANLGTTLCFVNTAIYKNNKSDVFSFLENF